MKEKIIEKRVMKMKKVFVTLLMLMMVVGLFAATSTNYDSIMVKTTLTGTTTAAFTQTAYTNESGDLTTYDGPLSISDARSEIEADRTTSIYASARTTSNAAITLKVYGTALTLNTSSSDSPSYNDKETIKLMVSLDSTEQQVNTLTTSGKSEIEFTSATPENKERGEISDCLTLVDKTSDSYSTRNLTGKLKIVAEKAVDQTAGTYEAYLWLDVYTEE